MARSRRSERPGTARGGERPGAAPPGVHVLDHTADVALEVRAPDLPTLLLRAAAGMAWLLTGTGPAASPSREPGDAGPAPLRLEAPDAALLLAAWLRELLFEHQVHGRSPAAVVFEELGPEHLTARIEWQPAPGALREIKGVTYHGLEAAAGKDGWHARVIFDV